MSAPQGPYAAYLAYMRAYHFWRAVPVAAENFAEASARERATFEELRSELLASIPDVIEDHVVAVGPGLNAWRSGDGVYVELSDDRGWVAQLWRPRTGDTHLAVSPRTAEVCAAIEAAS